MALPLAIPGRAAYRRLRSCLDHATDPSSEPDVGKRASPMDPLGAAFLVRLKSRRFPASPKWFAFLQFGIGGQMLRFHPFAASAGDHVLRISKLSGLAYLTEPDTGRTWASTLEPFRAARRAGRGASSVALAAPYSDLDLARRNAPRLARVAEWLKTHRQAMPPPLIYGQPLRVSLSGAVIPGLRVIDPVTGRQLVTMRSQSLHAGPAALTVQRDAIQISQDGTTVFFPVKDLLARWGNQLTRSAIYASAAEAREKAVELGTHRALGRLMVRVLASSREPDAELQARLEAFGANSDAVRADRRGAIGLVLGLPRRLRGPKKIAFRLTAFGTRARFTPALWWVPQQGLMVLWTATDGTVTAFGVTRREVRRFGVFNSVEAAREAAFRNPAVLLRESFLRRQAWEMDRGLPSRIAWFNNTNILLKADERQVPLANALTGSILQFRTSSSRGVWSPRILLSRAGPVFVMYSSNSARRTAWRAYGPLREDNTSTQVVEPSAEGRDCPTLDTLAVLLSKQLSVHVTAVVRWDGPHATVQNVLEILRRVIAVESQNWRSMDCAARVRLFYEFAEALKSSLSSVDAECRRDALVGAEYFYFGKPLEHILTFHAPLFSRSSGGWPAVFGTGGHADARAKEMARSLGAFVLDRPKQGLPDTMKWRFAKFLEAVNQLDTA